MEYIRQTVSSSELNNIFEIPPSLLNKMVDVIILPAENNNTTETHKTKRLIGFAKGAEVPDSFFEPLSEEDLQAWGL